MPPSTHEFALADLTPVVAAPACAPRHGALWDGALRHGALWDGALRRPSGAIGLAIVALVLGAALFGPALAPHDPFTITGGSLVAPSVVHPMGTDALGRDVFSGILYGARTSSFIASAACGIAVVIGTSVGLLAGYRGGAVDDLLMRITELFQVIPRFFFVIVSIALFGSGLDRTLLVIGLTSWPTIARLVRGEVIAIRSLDFVRAAEALGATGWHVAWHQLLPNVRPTLAVAVGLLFGQVLLLEATLGFLGLGDPNVMSWGAMAAQAQGFLRVAWWLVLFPGLAITVAVIGVNLLADALARARTFD